MMEKTVVEFGILDARVGFKRGRGNMLSRSANLGPASRRDPRSGLPVSVCHALADVTFTPVEGADYHVLDLEPWVGGGGGRSGRESGGGG